MKLPQIEDVLKNRTQYGYMHNGYILQWLPAIFEDTCTTKALHHIVNTSDHLLYIYLKLKHSLSKQPDFQVLVGSLGYNLLVLITKTISWCSF
jgi:hypothetical protein